MSKQPGKRKESPAEDDPGPRKRQAVVSNMIQIGNTAIPGATPSTSTAQPSDPPIYPGSPTINVPDAISFISGKVVTSNAGFDRKIKLKRQRHSSHETTNLYLVNVVARLRVLRFK